MQLVFRIFSKDEIEKMYKRVESYGLGDDFVKTIYDMIESIGDKRVWSECLIYRELVLSSTSITRFHKILKNCRKKQSIRNRTEYDHKKFYYLDLNEIEKTILSNLNVKSLDYSHALKRATEYTKRKRRKDDFMMLVAKRIINIETYYQSLPEHAKKRYLSKISAKSFNENDYEVLSFVFNYNNNDLVCLMQFKEDNENEF